MPKQLLEKNALLPLITSVHQVGVLAARAAVHTRPRNADDGVVESRVHYPALGAVPQGSRAGPWLHGWHAVICQRCANKFSSLLVVWVFLVCCCSGGCVGALGGARFLLRDRGTSKLELRGR